MPWRHCHLNSVTAHVCPGNIARIYLLLQYLLDPSKVLCFYTFFHLLMLHILCFQHSKIFVEVVCPLLSHDSSHQFFFFSTRLFTHLSLPKYILVFAINPDNIYHRFQLIFVLEKELKVILIQLVINSCFISETVTRCYLSQNCCKWNNSITKSRGERIFP